MRDVSSVRKLPYALDVFPSDLDDACRRQVDLKPLIFHFHDPAGNPVAVLEHHDGGLYHEGNGRKDSGEEAGREEGYENMLRSYQGETRKNQENCIDSVEGTI